jgi:tetratricopeptide (TPR) repeat protein
MPPTHPCRGMLFLFLFVLMAGPAAFGQAGTNIFFTRAEKAFQHARATLEAAPNDPTNCWQFARTCFDWADFSTNSAQREETARLGIAAVNRLIALDPRSAPGHYYLAMNYGQLAEAVEPSLTAFRLVKQIEAEFTLTATLDAHLDYAGPARNLGLLYRDAPGWPLSIGSKRKAGEFLELAVTLNPEYPENVLNLAESQLQWRLKEETEKTLRMLDAIWPAARTNFVGEAWEQSWSDWIHRRAAVKVAFQRVYNSAP